LLDQTNKPYLSDFGLILGHSLELCA
jgi:hypothetical protein